MARIVETLVEGIVAIVLGVLCTPMGWVGLIILAYIFGK